MAMEHQFIVPGSASLLKGRQGVIYEELGGLERQYRWKLGAMVELGTGAGGSIATDTLFDAAGDLVVGSGADTAARLAIGSAGQVLTSNGTTAAWASPAAGSLYLGIAASLAAAASAWPTAALGSTARIGASEAAYVRYEVKAQPSSSTSNWQELQTVVTTNAVFTLDLPPGKEPRRVYLRVDTDSIVQFSADGAVVDSFLETAAGTCHVIELFDETGAAAPALIAFQRLSASGGYNFSVEG